MTALSDFLTTLRGYTGLTDPTVQTDVMLTGYVRNGEARINEQLRVSDMVVIDKTLTIASGQIAMPIGWIANDLLLVGGVRFDWKDRSDYYDTTDKTQVYTVSGKYLIVDSQYNGNAVEAHYFADVPPLTDPINWVASRYPQLLTSASMTFASLGMIEDDRGADWETITNNTIQRLNDRFLQSQSWGTKLTKKIKGLG